MMKLMLVEMNGWARKKGILEILYLKILGAGWGRMSDDGLESREVDPTDDDDPRLHRTGPPSMPLLPYLLAVTLLACPPVDNHLTKSYRHRLPARIVVACFAWWSIDKKGSSASTDLWGTARLAVQISGHRSAAAAGNRTEVGT